MASADSAVAQHGIRDPDMSSGSCPPLQPRHQFARLFGRGGDQSHAKRSEDETLEIPEHVPKGLYLFGDVGTGKSMLMDLFYEQLPDNITHKRRIHFHQFMIDAHKRMHTFKALTHRPSGIVVGASSAIMSGLSAAGSEAASKASGDEVDPIPHVAMEFAQEATVLCFDEFQVTDIADAMILRRLLHHMIAHGVVLVTTSNRHPNDLYKNGIQRSSFIPCIELLKSRTTVKDLNSGTDYRKVPRSLSKVYYSSVEESSMREFEKLFEAFTSDPSDPVIDDRTLLVWGRKVKVPSSTAKVARFTFHELCGTPRSAADYIEICRTFPTIFIHDIPNMGLDQREVARRFITFIDAAYESKQKIFLSSEVPILQIFGAGDKGHKGAETSDAMREAMDALVSSRQGPSCLAGLMLIPITRNVPVFPPPRAGHDDRPIGRQPDLQWRRGAICGKHLSNCRDTSKCRKSLLT